MERPPTPSVLPPEILLGIFQYLPRSDYASCALVCQDWAEIVLDLEWSEVEDVQLLLQLLAPLDWDTALPTQRKYFSRPIQPHNWSRFKKYAHRVRTLHCDDEKIHSSVFALVATSCPYSGPLLPNLHALYCHADPASSQLLASPSIVTYQLSCDIDDEKGFELILRYLPMWMPNIESLRLFDAQDRSLEEPLIQIFPELRSLTSLNMPMLHLTQEVTEVLSNLPSLRVLKADGIHDNSAETFSDALRSGSFPVLEVLSLWTPFARAITCFNSAFSPTSLKSLTLREYDGVTSGYYQSLIQCVIRRLSSIESLSICYDVDDYSVPEVLEEVLTPPLFSIIAPLAACRHLHSLTVSFPVPLEPSETDLLNLVTALPNLRHLDLGHCQKVLPDSEPPIGIFTLSAMAPLCNSLEYLCLHMALTTVLDLKDVPTPNAPFKKLKTLDAWRSPVSAPIPVALFLSRILPSFCSLEYLSSFTDTESRSTEWLRLLSTLEVIRIAHCDAKEGS